MPKNKKKIIGWRLRNAPKPQPVAKAASKAPADAGWERDKAEWLEETKRVNAEFQSKYQGGTEEQKKPGLLDNISPDLSPSDRAAVILSRLENSRDDS